MYRQHRLREIGLRRGVSRDKNGLRRELAMLNRTWTFDPCTPCLKFCTPTFKILPNSLPGRDLSIDEAMVAFKGRSFMKQYMPAKPVKWGFKVWTVAEADTGYVSGYEIYTGRRAVPSQHGLGYDVVMQLTEVYQYQRRHLYFDNFFSSVQLLRDLEQRLCDCPVEQERLATCSQEA